nr:ATP-binding protein [Aquabacterium sp. A08]
MVRFHGRTGRFDLTLFFHHTDLLVWLFTVHHLGGSDLLLGLLVLTRIGDSVGFGFRRALYFTHLGVAVFVAYQVWQPAPEPGWPLWLTALFLYAVGWHLSLAALTITRLRRRNAEAAQRAEALVQTLDARTRDLQQQAQDLEDARRAAEAADRAKSSFLATMSHEIRTPMNGVIGMTELLRHTPLTAQQQEFVHIIRDSGQNLLVILNDILDYSKIESGRMELELRPLSVAAVLKACTDLLGPRAADKGVALQIEVDPALPPWVLGDSTRLRQVLINLLSNAIKFTPAGTVRVQVRVLEGADADAGPAAVREAVDAGPPVALEWVVQDTGVGMTPEQQARLFQPFSQVDASVSRKYGGTGLGLAISQRLVQAMGSQIGVSSQPAQGSTFRFVLPTREVLDYAETRSTLSMPLGAAATAPADTPSGRPVRILLAEDNLVNQRVALLTIQKLGHQVDVVDNGRAAVEAVQRQPYDLVLMDIQMPEMDGLTATREIIRRAPDGRRPFIVGLSANAMAEDVQAGRDAGMDNYLSKPFTVSDLRAVIDVCALFARADAP